MRADFSASDIVYVTDGLVSSVLQQCNTVSATRLEHSSQSAHGVFVLCSFCFERLGEKFNCSKLANPALLLVTSWNRFLKRILYVINGRFQNTSKVPVR